MSLYCELAEFLLPPVVAGEEIENVGMLTLNANLPSAPRGRGLLENFLAPRLMGKPLFDSAVWDSQPVLLANAAATTGQSWSGLVLPSVR